MSPGLSEWLGDGEQDTPSSLVLTLRPFERKVLTQLLPFGLNHPLVEEAVLCTVGV
jgi:hypothetical protein